MPINIEDLTTHKYFDAIKDSARFESLPAESEESQVIAKQALIEQQDLWDAHKAAMSAFIETMGRGAAMGRIRELLMAQYDENPNKFQEWKAEQNLTQKHVDFATKIVGSQSRG